MLLCIKAEQHCVFRYTHHRLTRADTVLPVMPCLCLSEAPERFVHLEEQADQFILRFSQSVLIYESVSLSRLRYAY